MKQELKITKDGSHTLFIPELDETYHSVHGSIQEAEHVFIQAGFNSVVDKTHLNILEVGFGTGLNAILSYKNANEKRVNVDYTGVELYPLEVDLIKKLNYTNLIEEVSEEELLLLHTCSWEEPVTCSPYFKMTKLKIPILEFKTSNFFDVIYFDAFGPNAQAEMWEQPVFEIMYRSLKEGGHLVTYCAKGSVKRLLKETGFKVEALPGPPGKREMTRAIK